ncbi:ABC transporter substrate-binding protein [Martelella endophytica]|uniref:ABC transporter substrate-binding protein n=1 Tax=Martelella endophytica TaxID=1486262 RepID=A0A0D5LKV4_MAREN|nr:sugar ABC transporter substrate-binding protein [Martelella endophytica]AJY44839.1 ABC transporter substrate-binding protein [Martelella endophytica]
MKNFRLSLLACVALGGIGFANSAFADPVTLKVWSIDGDDRPGIADTFSKEFDEMNDDITIEYRYLPFDDLVNETLRAYATGNAPDIVSLDNPDFALFSSRGAMLDITDRIANSDIINADNFFEGPLNSVTWDGKYYGIPKYTDTIAVFYNKDLFEKAGIDHPPQTWAEFAEDAEKLTDPENNVYGATFSARAGEEGTFQFLPIIQMSGGSFKNVNTDGAVEMLETWKKMIDNGWVSKDVLSLGQWDSTGTFNSGNAAMAVSGNWEIDRMVEDADFDWGVTLLPTLEEGGDRSSALGGFDWGIMSTTKHPDEAFRALEYFDSQADRLYDEFGYVAPRSDIEIKPSGNAKKDEAIAVFLDQLQYAQPRGPHPDWQKISKAIYDAEQAALTGQMSPRDALDQAQATIETIVN